MTGQDSITIEEGGRSLSGLGDVRVSPTATIPSIRGYVVFKDRVKHAEAMTDATVHCVLSDGRRPTLKHATVLSAEPGSHANGYTVEIMGTFVG